MQVAVRARDTTTRYTRPPQDMRDQRGATEGNLAIELDWAVRRRELEHAGEAPRRKTAERKVVRVQPSRKRERLPLLTMAGLTLVAVLAIQVLMSCIALTRLSSETVALNHTYQTLQSENEVLRAEYERTFDLASIKEAAEAAGMVKPGSGRIIYVSLPGEDSAVVYRQKNVTLFGQMARAARDGASAVVEYFN